MPLKKCFSVKLFFLGFLRSLLATGLVSIFPATVKQQFSSTMKSNCYIYSACHLWPQYTWDIDELDGKQGRRAHFEKADNTSFKYLWSLPAQSTFKSLNKCDPPHLVLFKAEFAT